VNKDAVEPARVDVRQKVVESRTHECATRADCQ